jgi:hypothetical protein
MSVLGPAMLQIAYGFLHRCIVLTTLTVIWCAMADDGFDEGGYTLLDDNDPHYTAIGLVATRWGILEHTIDGVIAGLAATGEAYMACVTSQLIGPAKRMDALIALFSLRGGSEELRRELKSFQGRIQQLGEDRNRVVHDPLFRGKNTGKIYKLIAAAKGKLEHAFRPTSLEEIRQTAADIKQANYEFLELKKKIDAELLD